MIEKQLSYYVGNTLEELFTNIANNIYRFKDTLLQYEPYKYLIETRMASYKWMNGIAIDNVKYFIYNINYRIIPPRPKKPYLLRDD